MKFKQFKVTDQCIGCMACVGIAEDIFKMNDEGKAFVVKQVETKEEEQLALEAKEACPVEAIVEVEPNDEEKNDLKPITSDDNVKEVLDKYPELKTILSDLSPKFQRLQNPIIYNTLAKFATFKDAAKVTGVSLCELLHTVNKYLGTEKKLMQVMPECIKSSEKQEFDSEPITWQETNDRYVMNSTNQDEILSLVATLKPQQNIVIITTLVPDVLVRYARFLGFKINVEKGREYRISIFNPQKAENEDDTKHYEVLDLRSVDEPLQTILQTASRKKPGEGFTIIQNFKPEPVIKMLEELGFKAEIDESKKDYVEVRFTKQEEYVGVRKAGTKPKIVLQSATPVTYPLIMALLQSKRLKEYVEIEELKVWKETEKHLSWIVNGKADISFSAVITSSKLRDLDVKVPAVVVWDNFVLLTRGYVARSFSDIKGKEIYVPLFADAPPAKITRYLIKAHGYDPDDFKFRYGKPFGRPEIIYQDLVLGKIDTAVLREPEASYAIKIMEDQKVVYSELRFDKLWNDINPGFGDFPNAGVVIKGEFMRKYPEVVEVFLDELQKAIDFVTQNKQEAAKISYQFMQQKEDRVLKFLQRVKFKYQSGGQLREKIEKYFRLLNEAQILDVNLDRDFLEMFG